MTNKDISSLQEALPPMSTAGRRTQGSEISLSSEARSSEETLQSIGTGSKSLPRALRSKRYHRISLFDITGPLLLLEQIMPHLVLLTGRLRCIMDPRVQESPFSHGNRPERIRTLKILALNFGTAIKVKKTLLSMNFGEVSTLDTYCGGWIVTLVSWKLKGVPEYYVPRDIGLHPICIPRTGTPIWTEKPQELSLEDSIFT